MKEQTTNAWWVSNPATKVSDSRRKTLHSKFILYNYWLRKYNACREKRNSSSQEQIYLLLLFLLQMTLLKPVNRNFLRTSWQLQFPIRTKWKCFPQDLGGGWNSADSRLLQSTFSNSTHHKLHMFVCHSVDAKKKKTNIQLSILGILLHI